MEISSVTGLSELGMDNPTFMDQCQMNSFDDFTSQQMAAALGDDLEYSFSSEIYSSTYKTLNPTTTTFSSSSFEKPQPPDHRPMKQLNTHSRNSCTTDHMYTPETSASPQLLCFGNSNSSPPDPLQYAWNLSGNVNPKDEAEGVIVPSDFYISQASYGNQRCVTKAGHESKRISPMKRSTSHPRDHILAERKRREMLSQRFIALSAIVPGLKKLDKASVLEEAIKHMKQLQERMKQLEEETAKKTVESVVFIKKSQLSADDETSSSDENFINGCSNDPFPEIEARVSDRNMLIRIHCEKQKGILVKALSEIEKLHLTVVNSNVVALGNSTLDITIVAQMEVGFCMTLKDLVRNILRSAFSCSSNIKC